MTELLGDELLGFDDLPLPLDGKVTALTDVPQLCSSKFPTPGRFGS